LYDIKLMKLTENINLKGNSGFYFKKPESLLYKNLQTKLKAKVSYSPKESA